MGILFAVALTLLGGQDPADPPPPAVAGGRSIRVVVEDPECRRALEIARTTDANVLVQLTDEADARRASEAADAAGLYGTRIFVARGSRIGLADNLADAVEAPAGTPKEEVLRVLAPGGRGRIGTEEFVKPAPAGMDDWSHHYHGPDNNPQSKDTLARAPFLTHFVVAPRYGPAPQAAVSSGGRLFMAFGHVAWHRREEPVLNTLVALNAFNGARLWTRPLKAGIMVDRSTMVATPWVLYLADDESCKVLDAATGELRDEIVVPRDLAGGTFWKWMALEGDVLYALVGPAEPTDPVAKWQLMRHGWPWTGISKGYNDKEYPWGFAKTLVALDPRTKKVLWHRSEEGLIDARSLCLKGGRIFLAHFGKYVSCLDAGSGRELWRRTAERDAELFQSIGEFRATHGYIQGWKSTVYLHCTDKAVYFAGPQTTGVTALSADEGKVLWKRPEKNLQILIREDGVWLIGAEKTKGETRRVHPLTGEVLASYDVERRACTRVTGGPDGLFFRAYDGTTRLDASSGKPQWISPMRPSCQVGVLVANGHAYWVPWACDCNLQMFGVIALGPAGDYRFDTPAAEAERLGGAPAPFPVAASDWPVYRSDNARSGRTSARVPEKARLAWTFTPKAQAEATAPVAAGGLVFVGGADGIVRALDAESGAVRWTAYTGGAVRFPPSVADGRAFVGSGDGWAYALEAATGKTLWRFRAAPAERRIPLYESLLSTWPVASGVLVHDGVAYLAAGINCMDGTHVYALDAATGKLRWHNGTSGHLDAWSRTGVAVQGELLLHDGRLYLAGGNAASPGVYDIRDGMCHTPPPQGIRSLAPRGRELAVGPRGIVPTGQPFYSAPGSPVYDKSVTWEPVVVAAANARLRLTGDAGSGWKVAAETAAEPPAPLWEAALPAEPQRWGIAVDAAGRVFVTLRDGRVLCWR